MLTWDASIGAMFQTNCAMCHNASLPTNGLSFASYADALRGGSNGPVIVPGDANSSKLVVIQSSGGHPGQFSLEELAAVKNWIDAEALEK
jgi:mono/diheme cytochrome c family protein